MSWRKFQAEGRRLATLQLLREAGYRVNSQMLTLGLEEYGYWPSQDELLADIAWLRDQQLVTDRDLSGATVIVELTRRGLDVADGRVEVPGVSRPRPEL